MRLDHVVVNAKTDLDGLAHAVDHFGFRLSPRASHSLGSRNQVAVFDDNYLELVGVPPGQPDIRPEISQGRTGVDGIVFRTQDAAGTRAELAERGWRPTEVAEFSRPVPAGDTSVLAWFRTVRIDPSPFRGERVYFCQHLTPELVWQPGVANHPNGSRRIRTVTVVSANPEGQAALFARLDGGSVELASLSSYRSAYGEQALAPSNSTEFVGALTIECDNPEYFTTLTPPQDWRCVPIAGSGMRMVSDRRGILIDFITRGGGADGQ
jgi:hypothetical protein